MRFAREGYPIVAIPAVLTALLLVFGRFLLAAILGVLSLGLLAFFRDPERVIPSGEDLIVAPADGKVVSITLVNGGPLIESARARISIFLSPLDVHINRAPIASKVTDVRHQSGKFVAAYKDEASERNEQNALRMVDKEAREVGVVQVAGVVARRIICKVKQGDILARGARFGLIMFGSRTDLYLPATARIDISEGQRVKGGETIIGRFV
jgi:phosphatidylserine decarboxylase